MDKFAQARARQKNQPIGLVFEGEGVQIWTKTWGQIIEQCRARLTFYQKHLQYEADYTTALTYLQEKHDKYLPKSFKQ